MIKNILPFDLFTSDFIFFDICFCVINSKLLQISSKFIWFDKYFINLAFQSKKSQSNYKILTVKSSEFKFCKYIPNLIILNTVNKTSDLIESIKKHSEEIIEDLGLIEEDIPKIDEQIKAKEEELQALENKIR